jgi:polysaccharide export outer membrane protein
LNFYTVEELEQVVRRAARLLSAELTVDGAVAQPGQFGITGPMTLIQAISLARGTSEDANARRVAVFRTIGGQRQAAAFDLTAIRRGEAPDPAIYPGDIVVVDGSKIKEAQKQILSGLNALSIFRVIGL